MDAIGFCAGQMVHTKFMQSLFKLSDMKIITVISGPAIYDARNTICDMFLNQTECDRLLMVDTDMIFTPDDIKKLQDHNAPIVSGLYASDDGRPMAGTWGKDGLWDYLKEIPVIPVVVDAVGAGFMLIERRVLEQIKSNWFDHITVEHKMIGEDLSFCKRVNWAGYKILIDPSVKLGHLKTVALWPGN